MLLATYIVVSALLGSFGFTVCEEKVISVMKPLKIIIL